MLLSKSDINEVDKNGFTALLTSISKVNGRIADLIIAKTLQENPENETVRNIRDLRDNFMSYLDKKSIVGNNARKKVDDIFVEASKQMLSQLCPDIFSGLLPTEAPATDLEVSLQQFQNRATELLKDHLLPSPKGLKQANELGAYSLKKISHNLPNR